jgi:hypothetical protein
LPRDVYKKIPRSRLLLENVSIFFILSNGEPSESSNPEDGCITSFISLSLIFSCSEEQEELTHRVVYHPQDSFHHLIPFCMPEHHFKYDNSSLYFKNEFIRELKKEDNYVSNAIRQFEPKYTNLSYF